MSAPRASVLLSAYEEERFVGDAIRSVQAQTLADLELIVVDDGSADGTAAVVEGFLSDSRVRLIRQRNRGLAPSLNTAAAAARAPRLALIDADDLWFPDFLEKMLAALDADPGAGFAYTDAWWLQVSSGRFFRRSISEYLGAPAAPPDDPKEMLAALLPANWVFGLTAIDRAAFEAVGGFDEGLPASEDYELWLRLLATGYRAAHVPGRLAVQRDRSDSMSADPVRMLPSLRSVYEAVAALPELDETSRALARRRLDQLVAEISAAEGGGARRRLRSRLAAAVKRIAPGLVWHSGVPAEVRAALPGFDFAPRGDLRRA